METESKAGQAGRAARCGPQDPRVGDGGGRTRVADQMDGRTEGEAGALLGARRSGPPYGEGEQGLRRRRTREEVSGCGRPPRRGEKNQGASDGGRNAAGEESRHAKTQTRQGEPAEQERRRARNDKTTPGRKPGRRCKGGQSKRGGNKNKRRTNKHQWSAQPKRNDREENSKEGPPWEPQNGQGRDQGQRREGGRGGLQQKQPPNPEERNERGPWGTKRRPTLNKAAHTVKTKD